MSLPGNRKWRVSFLRERSQNGKRAESSRFPLRLLLNKQRVIMVPFTIKKGAKHTSRDESFSLYVHLGGHAKQAWVFSSSCDVSSVTSLLSNNWSYMSYIIKYHPFWKSFFRPYIENNALRQDETVNIALLRKILKPLIFGKKNIMEIFIY